MSRPVWTLIAAMSWLTSVVVAFALGAWWSTNLPPLPGIGAP